jgi:hypothetical protein
MSEHGWALITGSSSGLGAEYARQLARAGHPLVLVARDRRRLEEFARSISAECGVTTEVLVADLHKPADRARVARRLGDSTKPVSVLVNNAGYGIAGDLADSDDLEEMDHLAIHVSAPLELTKAVLPGMLERGFGRVVIVASVAGYLARGTYSAHKTWGLSLARSLNETYRRRGVHVSAVAPGFTRTEFHQRMGMNVSGVPGFMWLDASRVVASSVRAVNAGKSVVIPSLRYRALVAIAQIIPRRFHQGGV